MTRTELKKEAKDIVIYKLLDCQEFGREFVQNINSGEWTSEQVDDIANEVAKQAERALKYLER